MRWRKSLKWWWSSDQLLWRHFQNFISFYEKKILKPNLKKYIVKWTRKKCTNFIQAIFIEVSRYFPFFNWTMNVPFRPFPYPILQRSIIFRALGAIKEFKSFLSHFLKTFGSPWTVLSTRWLPITAFANWDINEKKLDKKPKLDWTFIISDKRLNFPSNIWVIPETVG